MINYELAKEIGATHCLDTILYKFNDNAQALCYFSNFGWELSENSSEVMSRLERIDFDSIAQVDSEEWDGEGLPPVGVKCVYVFNDETEYLGFVAAYHDDAVWFGLDGGMYKTFFGSHQFRKPETPQQREERERLEAIRKLVNSSEFPNGSSEKVSAILTMIEDVYGSGALFAVVDLLEKISNESR